jgi:hypothetical protein
MGDSIRKLGVVPIFGDLRLMLLATNWFGEPSYKVNDPGLRKFEGQLFITFTIKGAHAL